MNGIDDPRGEDFTPVSRDLRIRAAAYVGVLAAFLSGVQNDPFTAVQLVFFGLAAAWSLGFEHRYVRPFFPPALKIGLVILGALIFIVFLVTGARASPDHFANAIARFLFWNAVVFVLSRGKTEYDLWTLAIINMSLFMISAAFVQPPDFVPLLLVSLASFLYVFQRHAVLRCGAAGARERETPGLTLVTLTLCLEIAVLIFLFFPRHAFEAEASAGDAPPAGEPPMGEDVPSRGARTGHPDQPGTMNLTQYHRLKKDPAAVLRILISDDEGGRIDPGLTPYLRGAPVDIYRNGRWSTRLSRVPVEDSSDGRVDGWTPLLEPLEGRRTAVQTVLMEPIAADLAFALPDAARVQWPSARVDPKGSFFFAAAPVERVQYRVESALMPMTIPQGARPDDAPPRYLQVPGGLDGLRALVEKHRERLRGHGTHGTARYWEQFLMRNGYEYRVEPFVPEDGVDPVEHFLFVKKSGYCTHYATALALLCRASGVPARVATGFQLHAPIGDGSYLVRKSDAHAWVEVWFGDRHGWRAYDATPPEGRAPAAAPEMGPDTPTEKGGSDGTPDEAPSVAWDTFIRDFDRSAQAQALRATAAAVGDALGWVLTPVTAIVATLAVAALVAVYCLMPGAGRRRLRQAVSGFRERTTIGFYRDFLWALARRGVRKPPTMTAREFARQARARIDDEGIDFVTDRFYEARYAGRAPGPEDARRIEEVIARLLRPPEPDPKPQA